VKFTYKIINHEITSSHTATQINYRKAVPAGSDFPAYHNFPEVYHGQGITAPPFSGGSGRSRGRGLTQHMEEKTAGKVAHLVFTRRSAPEAGKKIRNSGFSDLRGNERGQELL